ncbi:MFS transporter [Catenulispora pinisilvae]|uniref:MFS transporter n=1 Tax=Catenulispora pinisilvae TaxID=2705253 RepID=UPI00189111D7|nr:MFS transporter [Catenulispora pinisilvae]
MNPLHEKPFRRFFIARSISVAGSAVTPVSLTFSVLQLTGSAKDLSFVVSAQLIPTIALLLIGGGVADRVGQALLLRVTHFGSGLSQAAIAFCLFTRQPIGYLIALAFVNGVLQAFTGPALSGIVPQLVGPEGLRRANSLLATVANATKVIGPSVAGVLVATVGGGWALSVDSASFFIAAIVLALIPVQDRRKKRDAKLFTELRQGWTFFRSTPWFWSVTLAYTVVNLVQMGAWQLLGPVLARGTFGAGGWGAILSCRAAGALVMSVLMVRLNVKRPLLAGQLAMTVAAVPLMLLGVNASVVAIGAATFCAGLASSFGSVLWDTALHTHVPNEMMSRAVAYDQFGSYCAIPIGQLSVIPLATAFGARHVALAAGVIFLGSMVAPLALGSVRRLGSAPIAATPMAAEVPAGASTPNAGNAAVAS